MTTHRDYIIWTRCPECQELSDRKFQLLPGPCEHCGVEVEWEVVKVYYRDGKALRVEPHPADFLSWKGGEKNQHR